MLGASFVSSLLYGVAVLIIACPLCPGSWQHNGPLWWGQIAVPRWGFSSKMEQFYRKSKKFKLLSLIRLGLLTEGKPVVTDIIGDEVEVCLDWQPPRKKLPNTHWLRPLGQARVKLDLEIQTGRYQALHGKGVSGQIKLGKQVLLWKC